MLATLGANHAAHPLRADTITTLLYGQGVKDVRPPAIWYKQNYHDNLLSLGRDQAPRVTERAPNIFPVGSGRSIACFVARARGCAADVTLGTAARL